MTEYDNGYDNGYDIGYADAKADYGAGRILDEIRAEIENHRRKTRAIDPYDLVGDCLYIFDKCKAKRSGGSD